MKDGWAGGRGAGTSSVVGVISTSGQPFSMIYDQLHWPLPPRAAPRTRVKAARWLTSAAQPSDAGADAQTNTQEGILDSEQRAH